jgi:hypothetical protein
MKQPSKKRLTDLEKLEERKEKLEKTIQGHEEKLASGLKKVEDRKIHLANRRSELAEVNGELNYLYEKIEKMKSEKVAAEKKRLIQKKRKRSPSVSDNEEGEIKPTKKKRRIDSPKTPHKKRRHSKSPQILAKENGRHNNSKEHMEIDNSTSIKPKVVMRQKAIAVKTGSSYASRSPVDVPVVNKTIYSPPTPTKSPPKALLKQPLEVKKLKLIAKPIQSSHQTASTEKVTPTIKSEPIVKPSDISRTPKVEEMPETVTSRGRIEETKDSTVSPVDASLSTANLLPKITLKVIQAQTGATPIEKPSIAEAPSELMTLLDKVDVGKLNATLQEHSTFATIHIKEEPDHPQPGTFVELPAWSEENQLQEVCKEEEISAPLKGILRHPMDTPSKPKSNVRFDIVKPSHTPAFYMEERSEPQLNNAYEAARDLDARLRRYDQNLQEDTLNFDSGEPYDFSDEFAQFIHQEPSREVDTQDFDFMEYANKPAPDVIDGYYNHPDMHPDVLDQ